MTLKQATRLVKETYINAIHNPYVNCPLAYALYHVWQVVDREETEKLMEENNNE